MSINLKYKHQQKTYELMKNRLAKGKKVAYVFPVGCGKSFPVLKFMEDNKDKNALIVVPSIGIKNQFKKYIKRHVDNGKDRLKNKEIQIVTYQKISLSQRLEKGLRPNIIVFDEIHRIGAETWEPAVDELIENFPQADVIGISATPERTDKRNMAYEKFDEIIYEMSLTQALSGEKENETVLKTPRYIRVISQLKQEIETYKEQISSIEDENKKEILLRKYERLEKKVSSFPNIQDVMKQGMKKKNGKYIVFCKDREDMLEKMNNAQEIFGKVNTKINMEYVLSKSESTIEGGKTPAENRKTLERFEQKENGEELNLLFCVDMLNEGVHLEGIDGEVMFRPTESNILYKQQMGRVLSADKEAGETVIIDVVNNWLRQIETYTEIEKAIQKGTNESIKYDLLHLTPDETDLLDILTEIRDELRYNNNAYEEIIEWLETHDGKMPRTRITKKGKILKIKEMTQEEKNEVNLYGRWKRSNEYKVLKEYAGKPIEEVPEEHREKIEILRSYGLGLRIELKQKTVYEEIIEWLETHNGKMPRVAIWKNGKLLKAEEKTEKEKKETNLYVRWNHSDECIMLMKYAGKPIEEVPEEYREKIEILRSYGIGLKQKTAYEEIIEWLETHDGKTPRSKIYINGKELKANEKTEEEKIETNLYARWRKSDEYKILKEYEERPIEEVPKEYREKIAILRKLIKEENVYVEVKRWLETHDGKMPRSKISKNGKKLKVEEMTEEQKEEKNLGSRWQNCDEYKILKEYEGRPIEEVPKEYREKIQALRELMQKGKDKQIIDIMKKSVGEQVENNAQTRQELNYEIKKEENKKHDKGDN